MKIQNSKFKMQKLVMGSLVIGICLVIGIWSSGISAPADLEAKLDVFLQALDLIKNDYVEKNLDDTKLIYGAIKGVLDSLDDPYSRFMEPSAFQEMKIRMSGTYNGIGIFIGIKEKQLMVIAPIEGTPADKAGLKAKDKIMSIDGKSTKDMALEEAVSLIRGPRGTTVKLGILRGKEKEPKDYLIIREKIVIKSVKTKMLEDKIGYIKLQTFESQTAVKEMKEAILQVKKAGAKGLILDMRGNGGGLLGNAIEIASMFVKEGAVVHTVDREGRKETATVSGRVLWTKPLAVLVNDTSASASEILAGAIQDNKAGTLVGTHTFGKASVQNIRNLTDGSAILLTVAKYLTPSGRDISKKGIEPDVIVEVPKPTEEAVLEEEIEKKEEDLQLEKAIEIIKEKIRADNSEFEIRISDLICGVAWAEETGKEYIIGAGDVLEIHAWDRVNPDLLIVNPPITVAQGLITAPGAVEAHSVKVSRDGRVYIPLIGTFKVAGMTIGEFEEYLRKGLLKYSKEPTVVVMVREPKKIRVYVTGQVEKPGMQEVPDGAPEEARLLNFINLAGGFTDYANLKALKVLRGKETIPVDLIKLEVEGDYTQNVILKDGDTVVVPQTFNQVYVLGQVYKPGPVKYIEGAGVGEYIGQAGGFTKTAASDNIGIIRGDPANPKIIKVKLSPFFNLGKEGLVAVLPGDVIFVPQSWYADWADIGSIVIGFRDARDAAKGLLTPSQWRINFNE